MSSDTYRIIFAGQTLENISPDTAKNNLRTLLPLSDDKIERLFSGKAFVIKKELNRKQAEKYVAAFTKAGLAIKTDPPLEEELDIEIEEYVPEPKAPAAADSTKTEQATAQSNNPYTPPAAEELLHNVHSLQCGAKIGAKDPVCHQCGAQQLIGKPKSQVTAGFLAICLGWLGAHRFYLGQWWGFIYFILGIFVWPIAIIEGIVFFLTPKEKWEEKYGNVYGLSTGVLIIIATLVFIAVVGILAAIALPQYVEYTNRAKIHEALPRVEEAKQRVESVIVTENVFPNSNQEAGLPDKITGTNLLSLQVQQGGVIQVIFQSDKPELDQKTIVWVPEVKNGQVLWDCSGGDLSEKYRPIECREGKYQTSQVPNSLKKFVSYDGLLEITIPESWGRLELADDALIQAGNEYSEAYLMVHSESKGDLTGQELKYYGDVVVGLISSNLNTDDVKHIGNREVKGRSAEHYQVNGKVNNYDVVYLVSVIDGSNHFYQVVSWTLASRFTVNKDNMQFAINSLNERAAVNQ